MPLPTVILPGYLENAIAYYKLEQSLQELGFPTVTVPLKKRNWLTTLGGKSVTPIVELLDSTVKQVLQQYNTTQINLIGHSAGGWISRIYLGEKPYSGRNQVNPLSWSAYPHVATLVTLGTPHMSQERWTRWNLDFVNQNYPGAFYPQVRYVCVAGKSIFGQKSWGSWLAHSSYQLTCGQGDTWGDGITPVTAAHLAGAENLTIEGVLHSPKSPGIWYGSRDILDVWVKYLT
ncbi:MAG: triacylglycerol lipase [Calothrix sp. MO_167.B12]|nr:triacylglycerol lipase [Calothrix sp. MO_167.B12]